MIVKGALVALMLLISAALAFAVPPDANPAADACNQYTPTYIDVSVADSSDTANTVTLALKIFTLDADGTTYKYFDAGIPPSPPINPLLNMPDTPYDFYVYRGLKSADVLLLNPVELNVRGGDLRGQADLGNKGNPQEARITLDRPASNDCFITIIYWGHVEYNPVTGDVVEAGCYSPTFKTLPVCQTGAPSLVTNGVTSSTLCLPLVLLLGLLAAAMYVQGKNPLAAFDFSSPRVTGGRPYTMRKGGQVNSFGYLLFNVGNYVGGGVAPVVGSHGMTPMGTMMGGTGGGQASGKKSNPMNPSGKDVGKGAGGTVMGAVGEFASLPTDIKNVFSKPKLTVDAFGGEAKMKDAVHAGEQALISGLPLGPMLGRLFMKGGQDQRNKEMAASSAKDTGEVQTLRSGIAAAQDQMANATASQKASFQKLIDANTAKIDAINKKYYDIGTKMLAGINQAHENFVISMDALDQKYADKTDKSYLAKRDALVDKFNVDTLRLRQGLEIALGYSAQSLRMTQAIASDPILRAEYGNALANIQKIEDKLLSLPQTAPVAERNEMIWKKEELVQQAFLIQEISKQNEKNPDSKISIEGMQKELGIMKGEKPPVNDLEQLAKYYYGALASQDPKERAEALDRFLSMNGAAGARYLLVQDAKYAQAVNAFAAEATKAGDLQAIAVADVILGGIGANAGLLGLAAGEMERRADNKQASEFLARQTRTLLPQTFEVSVSSAQALLKPGKLPELREYENALSKQVGALQEIVAVATAPLTSSNIDKVAEDYRKAMNAADGSGRAMYNFVTQNPALASQLLVYENYADQTQQAKVQAKIVAHVNNLAVGPAEIQGIKLRADSTNLQAAGQNFNLGGMNEQQKQDYMAFIKNVFNVNQDLNVQELGAILKIHGSTEQPKVRVSKKEAALNEENLTLACGQIEQLAKIRQDYEKLSSGIYGEKPTDFDRKKVEYNGKLDELNHNLMVMSAEGRRGARLIL